MKSQTSLGTSVTFLMATLSGFCTGSLNSISMSSDLNAANGIDANERPAILRCMMVCAFQQNRIPKPVPQTEINAYGRVNIRKQFFTALFQSLFSSWKISIRQSINLKMPACPFADGTLNEKTPKHCRGLKYISTYTVMTLQTP